MSTLTKSHRNVIAAALAGFVLAIAVSAYVSYTRAATTTLLEQRLGEQEQVLQTMSDLITQDRADEVVAQVIIDCSTDDRQRFDAQLGRLNALRGADLQEMQILFARCGNYFAVQRSVMVTRLAREVEVYEHFASLQAALTGDAVTATTRATAWRALLALEDMRSDLSSELVRIQGAIITQLVLGASASDDSIAVLLAEAQEVRENLSFVGMQIEARRSEISAL